MRRIELLTLDNSIFSGGFERGDDLGALQIRRADLDVPLVADKQDLVQLNRLCVRRHVGQFNVQAVALGDLVLL